MENYSTSYSYNAVGAPLTLKRQGVIAPASEDGSTGAQYGLMDDLSYQWDGMLLVSVSAQACGSEFYGRTGYSLSAKGGTGSYKWNGAGLLNADSARGIRKTYYNESGQPTSIEFTDKGHLDYTYSTSGELIRVSTYAMLPGGRRPTLVSERSYCGGFVFEGDSLIYANFPGGYFDGEGLPHYSHTDFQGNITMVTDRDGQICQHTGYYPYGEPWREPAGQPYLYGGKERMRDGSLNDYDFSARRLNSALALWTAPDPMARDFSNINPYVYCAGNPIKYVDPTGCANIVFKGKIIGNDGINDNRMLVIPEYKKEYEEDGETVPSACPSKEVVNNIKKFVKENNGNADAFKNNKMIYDNLIEIESNPETIKAMNEELLKDDGNGGEKDENNREYGGYLTPEGFVPEQPGEVSKPSKGGASIKKYTDRNSFHTHPSGTEGLRHFRQQPSKTDIENVSNPTTTHYVAARGSDEIFIYTSKGIVSKMSREKFLNLYGIKK